ncbi:DUF5707 domain-containing protein [Streptomyces sp. NBC_01218]|uniref:DUF5707 domain-containing protein n=1 Tax=unclassified Streptomyces TaxID=2593676 RepID=UPI002E166EBE|nr:DUF5707 domain-containing protein [Streptomyces sp. NBC_01218]
MSKRVLVPSLIGAVVIGAVAAGGYAMASGPTEPTVKSGSARYTAPGPRGAGTFTYTADVTDDSGLRSLKVIAWPKSSKLAPTEAELRLVDGAACRATSDETAHCTYTPAVTGQEAAGLPGGTWYVSVLATAEDGDTTFVPRAATFEVTGR